MTKHINIGVGNRVLSVPTPTKVVTPNKGTMSLKKGIVMTILLTPIGVGLGLGLNELLALII